VLAFLALLYLGLRRTPASAAIFITIVCTIISGAFVAANLSSELAVGAIQREAVMPTLAIHVGASLVAGSVAYGFGRLVNWLYRRFSKADKQTQHAS